MPRLLLIEDDPLLAKVYRARFLQNGYDVEIVTDGAAAVERVASYKPQAVLLDIMLPGMNGIEILQRLRADAQWRDLPVIVFSNHFHETDAAAATKAGATAVLSKSEDGPDVVLEQVRLAIARTAPPAREPVRAMPVVSAQPPASPAQPRAAAEPDVFLVQQMRASLGPLRSELANPGALRRKRALLSETAQILHALTGCAGIGSWGSIGALSSAAEALANHLLRYPNQLNASCERTLHAAVSRLHDLIIPVVKRVHDLAGIHALVVDDDATSRSTAQFALGKAKIASEVFSDAKQALAALAKRRYGLIASDIMMDGMNGLQFADRVRTMPDYRDTPIIFVTGEAEFDKFDRSRLGCSDVIIKPFLFMELATKALVLLIRPA
jgi:CheY-like chemotaxis protein